MDRCLNKDILPVGLPGSTGLLKDLPQVSLVYQAYCHPLTGSSEEQDCLVLLTLEAVERESQS